jgi:hypothetical protein
VILKLSKEAAMKIVKSLIAAVATLLVSGASMAAVYEVPLTGTGSNKSASISTSLTATGAFQDTYNFTGISGAFNVNSVLSTLMGAARHDIDFTSITLNGQPFSLSTTPLLGNSDAIETATFATTAFNGSLTLVVNGTFTAGVGNSSPVGSYGGTINVTAVPEPHSYAMFAAGILLLTWFSRRRPTR